MAHNTIPYLLSEETGFPPVQQADSHGLLAIGDDLSPERLIKAYQSGIFPWFNGGSPILWWSPDPRMVLFPKRIKISKSMRKVVRDDEFKLTKNRCFEAVIDHCSKVKRQGQDGTWISREMNEAYSKLHTLGYAHSYEVWKDDKLVGGLYGIDLGHIFCGESMFSLVGNASKFAFIKLVGELQNKNYELVDCQLHTNHLESLGAEEIPRKEFMDILKKSGPRNP